MEKRLTKKQAKEFARVQSGLLIYNASGTEFDDTNLTDEEIVLCYGFMGNHHMRLLKNDNEYKLGSTSAILDYVRRQF